jgi:hypothetical protein
MLTGLVLGGVSSSNGAAFSGQWPENPATMLPGGRVTTTMQH